MYRNSLFLVFALVASLFIGAPIASAQSCGDPATDHASDCSCLPGFHATDRTLPPDPTDNPCIANAPLPTLCLLSDGTTLEDGAERCGCAAGEVPLTVPVQRSLDRMRSLVHDAPTAGHHLVFCYNPYALRSAPDSAASRMAALEAALPRLEATDRELREAIEAWCGTPTADQSLADACRAAIAALRAGSTLTEGGGPVDLSGILSALEALQDDAEEMQEEIDEIIAVDERQDHDMLDTREDIRVLSSRYDTLVECLRRGESHPITYTDSTGVTGTYQCSDIRAAAPPGLLRRAERAVRDMVRREVTYALRDAPGDAFIMAGVYGLVSFNPLTITGNDYGLPWQVGADLTLGIALGGGWNFMIGGGIGGTGTNIPGVTNVGAELHIGFDSWVERWGLFGFGAMSDIRFMTDGSIAQATYAAYADMTLRFLPHDEWTPVATFRGFIGVTPRGEGNNWHGEPDGGLMFMIGIAHFQPERPPPPPPPVDEDETLPPRTRPPVAEPTPPPPAATPPVAPPPVVTPPVAPPPVVAPTPPPPAAPPPVAPPVEPTPPPPADPVPPPAADVVPAAAAPAVAPLDDESGETL